MRQEKVNECMKEKVLVICSRRPYPLKSGLEINIYQYIKFFSQLYAVDVIYISDNKEQPDELNHICNSVVAFRREKKFEKLRTLFFFVFKGMPLQVGQIYYTKLQEYINEHGREYKFAFGAHIKVASYIMNLHIFNKNIKIFFDGIDSIALQSYNAYMVTKGWKKAAYWIEYKKMLQYEKQVYETIENTILISQRDRDYILNEVKAKCNPKIIYNYTLDLGYIDGVKKDECSICFMGKMDYSPNIEAVMYFVKNIYSVIKEKYKDLKLYIIGGNAGKVITKLNEIEGISVLGFVDNPAYYLQKSTLVIAPMRSGSGLQNKIVQAMYLECAVITSEIGADGLAGLNGDELVVYHSDADFIGKLLYYLSERAFDERAEIGKRARSYIDKTYSYEAVTKQIANVFCEGKV